MAKQEPDSDRRLREAQQVKDNVAAEFFGKANVTGVGVGYREVGGRRTDEVCIRVYVAKKVAATDLAAEDLLPERVEGILVDVIESSFETFAIADHRRRHHPLVGGVSGINVALDTTGTLGCRVFDNESGMDMLLSNWHVLCGRLDCSLGESVIQPGQGASGDGGDATDRVARLARATLSESVDAAAAFLTGHRFLLPTILGIGEPTGTIDAEIGMSVRKSGRTTGVTTGTIGDLSADVDVRGYPGGTARFTDQLIVDHVDTVFSAPGDSGSLVMNTDNRAVGLLFAGSASRTIANPIDAVLSALGVRFHNGIAMQDFVAITTSTLG